MEKQPIIIKHNNITKEIVKFLLVFVFTIIVVYRTNIAITNIYFILITAIAFKSEKDFFWVAFYILIYSYPGRLFYGADQALHYRLPLYKILSGISLGFNDIFPLALFLKVIIKKKTNVMKNKWFIAFIALFFIYLVISITWGLSSNNFIKPMRNFIQLLIYFPIVYLIKRDDIQIFIYLISLIVVLGFCFTIFFYINGTSFGSFFSGQNLERHSWRHEIKEIESFEGSGVNRYIDSLNILFTALTTSWYFLLSKSKMFNKNYLSIIIMASLFIIVLSGTRGWNIGFIMVIVFPIIFLKLKKNIIYRIMLSGIVLTIGIASYQPFRIQISNAFLRLATLEKVVQGDVSAGGTSSRVDEGQRYIDMTIKESPLFGFGFSDRAQKYYNSDTGMFTTFLEIGFFGLIILSIVALRYLAFLKSITRKNKYYGVFVIGFLSMLFMHSTTNIMFTLIGTLYASYWTPFYFGVTHLIFKNRI